MEQEKSEKLPTDEIAQDLAQHPEKRDVPPAENYFAPGTLAKHKYGVLYQGEFETPGDGTALAVRLHARALADAGLPVLLRSFSGMVVNAQGVAEPVFLTGLPKEVEDEVGDLTTTEVAEARPAIKHLVIRSAEHLKQALVPRWAMPMDAENIEAQIKMRDGIYDNSIVYSVWERDRIDPAVARVMAKVKQCWVPCEQNAKLLRDSGVPEDRVHVVPHPYREDDMIHACTRRSPGMHRGQKRFYSIGRWEPRKGFSLLMAAFLHAFGPGDNATLTIKWSGSGLWPQYPSPEQAWEHLNVFGAKHRWKEDEARRAITLIDGRVTRSKIVELHYRNNIYVSSSHGEAFNLSAYDAKLAGNNLVYVPWGGVCDFASARDIAVPCKMGDAHPSYKWEHGAQWAAYQIEDLAEGLRRAEVPEKFERPADFEERFSMRAVGQRMRKLVEMAAPALPEK